MQHGYGRETWTDKSSYEGDYNKGSKQGKGIYKYADGSVYEGDW